MSVKLKVIRTKQFEAQGQPHTHYSAAYKGRVFGVSTLRVPKEDITVDGDTITIAGDIEVLRNNSVDPLTGEQKTYLDIVPKSGLQLADF